jgi:hypothetical protein
VLGRSRAGIGTLDELVGPQRLGHSRVEQRGRSEGLRDGVCLRSSAEDLLRRPPSATPDREPSKGVLVRRESDPLNGRARGNVRERAVLRLLALTREYRLCSGPLPSENRRTRPRDRARVDG